MSRGVGSTRCDECRRRFGGQFVFERHQVRIPRSEDLRCLTAAELRRRGFRRRPQDGAWTQQPPGPRQRRLFSQGRLPRLVELAPGVCRVTRPQRSHTANPTQFLGQLTLFLLALTTRRAR